MEISTLHKMQNIVGIVTDAMRVTDVYKRKQNIPSL